MKSNVYGIVIVPKLWQFLNLKVQGIKMDCRSVQSNSQPGDSCS